MGLFRVLFYAGLGAGALYFYQNYVKPSMETTTTTTPPTSMTTGTTGYGPSV